MHVYICKCILSAKVKCWLQMHLYFRRFVLEAAKVNFAAEGGGGRGERCNSTRPLMAATGELWSARKKLLTMEECLRSGPLVVLWGRVKSDGPSKVRGKGTPALLEINEELGCVICHHQPQSDISQPDNVVSLV